jgi:putative peptidoglycan lipid II flippase
VFLFCLDPSECKVNQLMAAEQSPASSGQVLSGQQIQRATGVIAAAFLVSAVLGVLRQAIIASQFGAGSQLDAFVAAYRIPEMLFTLVAGGALGSAFIPVYSRFITNGDEDGGWQLASAVLTIVGLAGTVAAIVVGIFGQFITATFLVPNASPQQQVLTTELMRIMLCTVVIFGLSGLIMGVLNTHQHFLTPALAPSMNNLGLIFGAIFLAPSFGIYGLAIGAIIGSLLHMGVQLPALMKIKPKLQVLPNFNIDGVRDVLLLMGPRVIGQGVVQINFVVNTALASGMAEGSIAALSVAFALMFVVLGILGQSIGTAVFPTLSTLGAQGDMDGFRQTLSGALRNVIFLSLPASVGIIVLAVPLVATINQRGQWTAENTLATAWALRFFAVGLLGFALQEVLARAYYALRDTSTPVTIAVGGVVLNIILSLILIHFIKGASPAEGPFGGLALANALATLIESAALWGVLRRRISGLHEREIFDMTGRTFIAALVMGIVVTLVATALSNLSSVIILIVGAATGLLTFELVAIVLGVNEARTVPGIVLRRFRRLSKDYE